MVAVSPSSKPFTHNSLAVCEKELTMFRLKTPELHDKYLSDYLQRHCLAVFRAPSHSGDNFLDLDGVLEIRPRPFFTSEKCLPQSLVTAG